MDCSEFLRKIATAPSGMTIVVTKENGDDDFDKVIFSMCREFVYLFGINGQAQPASLYLISLLIVKYFNDLYNNTQCELSSINTCNNTDGKMTANGEDDQGNSMLSFPIAYSGEEIQQALKYIEKAFPDFLSGAFAQLDFTKLLKGPMSEKKDDFIKAMANCLSLIKFTFSDDCNQKHITPQELCHRILASLEPHNIKSTESFYPPAEIAVLMTQLVKPTAEEILLDPVCGSGAFLLSAVNYAASKSTCPPKIIGLEQDVFALSLARMILFLCGARNGGVFQGSLLSKTPPSSDRIVGNIDVILSNPPFSQRLSPKVSDALQSRGLLKYGATRNRISELTFIQVMLESLKPNHGRMVVVTSMGALFRRGSEQEIRRHLLEDGLIEAVISLPEKLFYNTAIPVALIAFRKDKNNKNVLFVNAANNFETVKRINILSPEHVKAIVDAYSSNKNIDNFSRAVYLEEIVQNEYDLSPSRYISSVKKEKITPVISDVLQHKKELLVAANDVEKDIDQLLVGLGYHFKNS